MKVCLLKFNAKRCLYGMNMSWSKEDQVKVCQNMKCSYGSITELKNALLVTCDRTYNALDGKEITDAEWRKLEYEGLVE